MRDSGTPATGQRQARRNRRHVVATAHEIAPGERKIVTVAGRSIGIFNVGGEFFALRNRCPHQGGALCRGQLWGVLRSEAPGEFQYDPSREILACPWHGWEFHIRTGQSWCTPARLRVRRYQVAQVSADQLAEGELGEGELGEGELAEGELGERAPAAPEQPAGEPPDGKRSDGERLAAAPPAAEPAAAATAAEHPAAEHPAAEHPAAEHPAAEHPAAEHPAAEHPAAEHPAAEHPAAERPAAEHPAAEHPAAEPQAGERRASERRALAGQDPPAPAPGMVKGPYVAETYPVARHGAYLVVEMPDR